MDNPTKNELPLPGFPIKGDGINNAPGLTPQPYFESVASEFDQPRVSPKIGTDRLPKRELSEAELKRFFISHLNRIYCAKNQLVDKLPILGERAHFTDLQQSIQETVNDVRLQIQRMNRVYILLDTYYQPESCVGLAGILDEAFQSIGTPGDSAELLDLSILFYMYNIESIEAASFKVMLLVADQLQNPEVSQLTRECYDESQEDRVLFKEITENYL